MIDIAPATALVGGRIPQDRLCAPTPIDCTIGEVLDHVQSLGGASRRCLHALGSVRRQSTSGLSAGL